MFSSYLLNKGHVCFSGRRASFNDIFIALLLAAGLANPKIMITNIDMMLFMSPV